MLCLSEPTLDVGQVKVVVETIPINDLRRVNA